MSAYLDLSTAESALGSIAEAYRRKDIEGAVACKDFEAEARLMLKRLGRMQADSGTLRSTAEALEVSFRKHTLGAWPKFEGVSSKVSELTPYEENIFIAHEVGTYEGRPYKQAIYMAKSKDGWKVLNPVPTKGTMRKVPWWRFW
jgi:hypothetical protein